MGGPSPDASLNLNKPRLSAPFQGTCVGKIVGLRAREGGSEVPDTRWLEQRRQGWYVVLDVPQAVRAEIGQPRKVQSLKTREWSVLAGWQKEFARARRAPAADALTAEALEAREWLQRAYAGERVAYFDPGFYTDPQDEAVRRGHVPENPWAGQRVGEGGDRGEVEKERPFTDAEMVTLLTAETDEGMADAMRLAALSGLRIGEMHQLRVSDIEGDGVFVRKGKNKNSAARWVPIHPDVAPILSRFAAGKKPDDFLLPGHQRAPAMMGSRIGSGGYRCAWGSMTEGRATALPGELPQLPAVVHQPRRAGWYPGDDRGARRRARSNQRHLRPPQPRPRASLGKQGGVRPGCTVAALTVGSSVRSGVRARR
jgi:integrase